MTDETTPGRDDLDNKVNRVFGGKVVRKDLVRKVKVGANVPVFVLEYLGFWEDQRIDSLRVF